MYLNGGRLFHFVFRFADVVIVVVDVVDVDLGAAAAVQLVVVLLDAAAPVGVVGVGRGGGADAAEASGGAGHVAVDGRQPRDDGAVEHAAAAAVHVADKVGRMQGGGGSRRVLLSEGVYEYLGWKKRGGEAIAAVGKLFGLVVLTVFVKK